MAKKASNRQALLGDEAQLWQMADALRGNMNAAEYKHVVLGCCSRSTPPTPSRKCTPRWGLHNIKAPTPTSTARNGSVGDHFAPREVILLMVSILFIQDDKLLAKPGTVRKLLDPVCGTGGMLAEPQSHLRNHHGEVWLYKLITAAVPGQIDVEAAA